MTKRVLIVLCVLFQCISCDVLYLNESEYERMPSLVRIDPYDECLRSPGAVYCNVQFTLVSDTDSPLLTMIKDYSAYYKKRFNHTSLRYAVCVTESCKDVYESNKDQKSVLEACLNETLWKTHRLKTKVADGFTCNVHKVPLKTGIWDTVMAVVCATIILLNIAGTLYHYHYGDEDDGKVARLLLSFSVARNWKKFTTLTVHPDPRLSRLQAIHGMRAIMTCAVIFIHSGRTFLFLLAKNPEFVEKLYDNTINKLLFNGPLGMQTFFMISGFLLVYNCLMYEESAGEMTWVAIPKLLFLRLMRLSPSYVLLLGFTATWLRFAPQGPMWQQFLGEDCEGCRKYWWQNLLYINNYFNHGECMPHTWSLATDCQLYCLGVVVFVACKTPQLRNKVLALLFAAGVVIPALHTYFQDLDAVMILHPESIVSSFRNHRYFNELYRRGHTNIFGYTTGLALGYLVYHWQKTGVRGENYHKYRYVYRSLWLVSTGVMYSGSIFYEDRPEDPMYVRVLVSSLSRPVYVLLIAATVAGAIFRIENVYRMVLEWRPWTYISRLSYGAYLLHMTYLRASAAAVTHTLHISYWTVYVIGLRSIVITMFMALVFWLLVEAPIANLMPLPRIKPSSRKVHKEESERADSKMKIQ